MEPRDVGTPQGSVVSPILANLFLHYAFDAWLTREFPRVTFERYVDDAVVHCVSRRQAEQVAEAIGNRMEAVGLRLHPTKTRIVYCKDANRRGSHEHTGSRSWDSISGSARRTASTGSGSRVFCPRSASRL